MYSGQQVANDIDITPSDGLVITGYYRYELVFGDGTEIDSLQSSVNENRWRGYVAQVDSDGEWEWAHQFGREGNDDSYANGVGVIPNNGDVYVVGVWKEPLMIGSKLMMNRNSEDIVEIIWKVVS